MAFLVDNSGESDYTGKINAIASALLGWQGPVVLVSHIDPDGDALGSSLALKRTLAELGKDTYLPLVPPRYLNFLCREGELSPPLESLPEHCLLVVLDAAEKRRVVGAPSSGASLTINIDHHGTNNRFGDLSCVEPQKAATAQIVKDIVGAMGVPWTTAMATPCLTGILTDTGNFRYGNTTPEVLRDASELLRYGVDYTTLVDRLQWREPHYFSMLGQVMSTVEFPLGGLVSMARLTQKMREEVGETDDDSNDYVGLIRYAEGTKVAVLLKEAKEGTKISVRTRNNVSAQAICLTLGGGGHPAAAGALVRAGLEETRVRVLEATRQELRRHGYAV